MGRRRMIVIGAIAGYAIGSMPTAVWIARLSGIDLLQDGSGNPGANNARRLGGLRLAAAVLFVEMAKGALAVAAGSTLAGDAGAVAAGFGAVAGNVYNIWYGFRGGKGLGIAAGVILTIWPVGLVILLATIALGAIVTRSSGKATLITLVVAVIASLAWWLADWDNAWGLPAGHLPAATIAITSIITPKHLNDARADSEKTPV